MSADNLWENIKALNWDEILAKQGMRRLTKEEQMVLLNNPEDFNKLYGCKFEVKDEYRG
jgi:hypothetical protein